MDSNEIIYERYKRQMILPQLGESGQQKLLGAKVLVVGAGGLGCPVLQYLAAAGIGVLGIVDDDVVSLSNLHRQVLYNVQDIGFSKAEQAKAVLLKVNPGLRIIAYPKRLTTANALDIIAGFDIVVDGTDNFSSRYLINDACVLLGKPLVYGAVSQFEGQVAVFNVERENGIRSVNYRDLFPTQPIEGNIKNCEEAGVLGVLPGIIGSMQANEVIKLVTGIGQPLINRLLTFNALNNQVFEMELSPGDQTNSSLPVTREQFEKTDYGPGCAVVKPGMEITVDEFDRLVDTGGAIVIDVREWGEFPVVTEFLHTRIPLSRLKEDNPSFEERTILVFCQSGKRSLQAVQYLATVWSGTKDVYSLRGGILGWKKIHSNNPV